MKTVIITGGSQGIGLALVKAFLSRNYAVVATSRSITQSKDLPKSPNLTLVDGDIGQMETAKQVVEKAGTVDALINNAGLFLTKPFVEYTPQEVRQLLTTNLEGFIYITQLVVKKMLSQKSGGSIVNISASLADNPIAGINASVAMITKGGIDTVTRSLAIEYAREGIRFNAVAPGVVDTPMHQNDPKDFLKTLCPMGTIADPKEIVEAVLYLTEAPHVTGEVLHVDGGAHIGKW